MPFPPVAWGQQPPLLAAPPRAPGTRQRTQQPSIPGPATSRSSYLRPGASAPTMDSPIGALNDEPNNAASGSLLGGAQPSEAPTASGFNYAGIRAAQPASPQITSDEAPWSQSLRDLDERLSELEKDRREERQPSFESRPKTGFTHDFFGRVQGDSVTFNQDAANRQQVGHAPNGVGLRRARLGMQGEGYGIYFYRIETDFVEPSKVALFQPATSATQPRRPRITDAYFDVMHLPLLGAVRAGQFRVPLSNERLTSANNTTFIERGLPQAFNISRQLGLMAFNRTRDYRFAWWNAVSTAGANSEGEQIGKAGRVALTNRLVWLPWYDQPSDGRYLCQFGAAYQYQDLRNATQRFATTPEVILVQGSEQVIPNFISTPTVPIRDINLLQCEGSTVLGPLSIQGEYYGLFVRQTVGPSAYVDGAYVFVSYFLTGEHRVYNRDQGIYEATRPFANFFRVRTDDRGIATGPGAWELAARFSTMNLNGGGLRGGRLDDFTLGLNWYMTPQLKLMANWIHAMNNRQGIGSSADVFLTRAQVVW